MPRPIAEWRSGSKENWNALKKQNKKLKKYSLAEYNKVLYTFNQILIDYVLETGDIVRFPFGLGHLSINKYKKTKFIKQKDGSEKINLNPDWKKTLDLWKECEECKQQKKLVYHLNFHSDGFSYYWLWVLGSNMLQGSIWKFELNRVHSRKLASLILQPNTHYKHLYKSYSKHVI